MEWIFGNHGDHESRLNIFYNYLLQGRRYSYFKPAVVSIWFLFSLSVGIAESSQGENGFQNVRLYENKDEVAYTHGFRLQIVNLVGAGWDKETILERYRKAAKILAGCQIKIIDPKYLEFEPIEGNMDFPSPSRARPGDAHHNLALRFPESERITAFHVRYYGDGSSLGEAGTELYYSRKDFFHNSKLFSEVDNVSAFIGKIWLPTRLLDKWLARLPEYSTEAHEIGHLLLNRNHHYDIRRGEDNNIMMKRGSLRNDKFSDDQCHNMKNSGFDRFLFEL